LLCLGSGGCGPQQSSVEPSSVEQPSAQQHPAQQNSSPQSAAPSATDPATAKSNTNSTSADPTPDSESETNQRRLQLLTQAEQQLKTGDWDELAETLESLAELPTQGQSEEQAAAIERLTTTAVTKRAEVAAQQRAARLAQSQQLIAGGRLDEAQRALSDVLTRGPTDEQRAEAQTLTDEIERVRKARRQLKSWIQLLGSAERKDVQAAQTQLLLDPDTALGMVLDALRGTQSADQAANYIETLGLLERPDIVMLEYIELLKDETKESLWPVIQQQLTAPGVAGAGEALLSLAAQSKKVEQRRAAWEALAGVADPPAATLLTAARLVPETDEATLPLLLQATTHAILVHGQQDLAARRGQPALQPADETALASFLQQLDRWTGVAPGTQPTAANPPAPAAAAAPAAPPAAAAPEPVMLAARRLATVLGRLTAPPISGIKIARVEAELPESPAAALLDGVWNAVEPKTMWRYPIAQRGVVLLDLGQERLVTAVRVWNLNETSGTQRGWKEIELFVSDNPAELTPATTAVVPPAAGVVQTAQVADFGTTITIPPTRARYVRLQAKSTWTTDMHSGLSEIQVLGW
ncbi:MAG: hypothetical protein ACKOBW_17660, partial [Planctomycetota bacterium]